MYVQSPALSSFALCRSLKNSSPLPSASVWLELFEEAAEAPVRLVSLRAEVHGHLQQHQKVEELLEATYASPTSFSSLKHLRQVQKEVKNCFVFVDSWKKAEDRIQKLQQLEQRSSVLLKTRQPLPELQKFLREQQNLIQLPEDTPDLPYRTRLKETVIAAEAWAAQTENLREKGGSLQQWRQHINRGGHLKALAPGALGRHRARGGGGLRRGMEQGSTKREGVGGGNESL